MCTLTAAFMAVSSVVSGAAKLAATNAYNANAAAAHQQERIAATQNYKRLAEKAQFDTQSINQQGMQTALKGRAARGKLQAGAGAAGVQFASSSLQDLLGESYQVSAENQSMPRNKRDDLISSTQYASLDAQNRASANISKLPFKDEGSIFAEIGLGIGGAAVKGLA